MFIAALFVIAQKWKQKCLLTNKWSKKMQYIHTREYRLAIKRNKVLMCYSMDDPWKHRVCKRSQSQKTIYVRLYLYEISRTGNTIEMESRLMAARGWGERESGEWLWGQGCFCSNKMLWNHMVVVAARLCKYTKTTELYTLQWVKLHGVWTVSQ